MQNISKEDYLSVIYKNKNDVNEVKPNLIADKLEITSAAVSDMLKKLAKEGLINYQKYKGISLTKKGEDYARNMVRRHRIWEVFLNQFIGLPWEKVHEEANRLEHSSSDELINKMEEMLDFPEYDPHGDPIPSKEGKIPEMRKNVRLTMLLEGEKGKVIRVNDFDEKFLNYISGIGIKLNKIVKVEEKFSFDKSMKVKVDNTYSNITDKSASNIFVEVIK
jgi:DtxR family transcriptional regulator, Mn-dependent transcriptional regulator